MAKQVAVIIGSIRAVRIGPQVAEFIKSTLESQNDSSIVFSLVDIKDFNLPIFDEVVLPAMVPAHAQFAHDHSKAWDAEIAKYDGYVFVTAEWNFSIPGGTKNAIDFLYHAWIGKPVLIVSYGIAGGKNASTSLFGTLNGMHLKVAETRPSFTFPGADPAKNNMSPSLNAAIGGELHEESLVAWKSDTEELLKGYAELKDLLAAKSA
jgi:NAD(P)H-dependent FMN reductase